MLSIHDSEIYKIAYSKENKDTFFKVTFFPFEGVSPNVEIKISIQYIFPICKKIRPRLLSIHDSEICKITYSKKRAKMQLFTLKRDFSPMKKYRLNIEN